MRVPEPFYRKQTQSWYVQIRGKQEPLGKDEKAAWQKYYELMAGQKAMVPTTPAALILDRFLDWVSKNQAPATYQFYKRHLASFAKFIGARLRVSDLKPYHVTDWVDRDYAKQSDTSKFAAYRSAERAFNWAAKQRIIETSPLGKLDKPTPNRRETYLTPDQFETVLARVKELERGEGGFYRFLIACWETGARPQEVRAVEAHHFDQKRGVWIFERKQSKGKNKRRVIYLSPRVRQITEALVAEYPTGKLFRNSKNRPWTKSAIIGRFTSLQGKKKGKKKRKFRFPPLDFPVHSYALRHGFATDRLRSGIDSTTVAGLLGHSSTRMLEQCYSHISAHDDHMRGALKDA